MTRVRAGDVATALRGALGPPSHEATSRRRDVAVPYGDESPEGEPTTKFTLRLLDDELVGLDELALALRRRLRRPVTKAEVVRALIVLARVEDEVLDAVGTELARASWSRRDVVTARRREGWTS